VETPALTRDRQGGALRDVAGEEALSGRALYQHPHHTRDLEAQESMGTTERGVC
jgi:hypothetical protein